MVKKFSMLAILVICFSWCYAIAANEKKLAIIITSYNNADWFEKNVGMMFCQKRLDGTPYDNYRIIYIDDCSLDGTPELVQRYVDACDQNHRFTLIKNKTRKRALANLYTALQMCEPDEIVFNMDGDDWLSDDKVFALIDSIYKNEDVWITYGSFINWPTNEMGYCQPITNEYVEKQLYRKKWWKPGQLRTFYAWLAHQVKLKDLFFEGPYFQGQFFPANADLAYYYPMMEMAGPHYKYIPDVIYIRNVATPLNDFKANKEVQILGSKFLREKPKYPALQKPLENYFGRFKNKKTDLIILSENAVRTQNLITSCEKLVSHLDTIHILSGAPAHHEFKSTVFKISRRPSKQGGQSNSLLATLKNSKQDYVIIMKDTGVFTKYTNCAECIAALERAFAYSFSLSLGCDSCVSHQTGSFQPMPALNQIHDDIYAWAFHYAEWGDWRNYNNCGATLYRTQTLKEQLSALTSQELEPVIQEWSTTAINLEQVGLCYESPHVNYINW